MDIDTRSSTDLPSSPPLTRAEGLWFQDCGLIIQAESTLFRVSGDLLGVHSPVFRDMSSLPQPKHADMMDGCPFVVLQDSAEDVHILLKALFYCDFFEAYPAPTTLPILTAILRMSYKYDVDALRKRSLTHLASFHPTTLAGYDALTVTPTRLVNELQDPELELSFVDIAVLARNLSIDWILPVAFYRICQFTFESTILTAPLDLDDKVRIITNCRILEGSAVSKVLAFLWPSSDHNCDAISQQECRKSRFALRQGAEECRERSSGNAATMPLDIWTQQDWDDLDVCKACLSSMRANHRAAKQALWDELPELFGLPPWKDLKKMKAEALQGLHPVLYLSRFIARL
ncbi:hypothetical protein C8R47DRAFT_1324904 [Mycena vitilis]|nr:hypothetical protein C8R47DRAFT_1324904 [Mycena vitilis]